MIDTPSVDDCIEQLYDAVGDGARLVQALGAFRPHFGAKGVVCLSFSNGPALAASQFGAVGVTERVLVEYQNHFNAYDEWGRATYARGMPVQGQILLGNELVPPAQLRQTYFWQQMLEPADIADMLSCVVETTGASGITSVVTLHRSAAMPLYGPAEVELMAALRPHLCRALRLHRRLAPQIAVGSTLAELFRDAPQPMVYLGEAARVVQANPAARAMMDEGGRGGAALLRHAVNGVLHVATSRGWQGLAPQFEAFMADATTPAMRLALSGAQGEQAVLDVRRVHGASADTLAAHRVQAIAVLSVLPPDPVGRLTRNCDLTGMESLLLAALVQGQSLQAFAQARGVSINTVRTHLRHLLEKTGTTRQAELVARALGAGSEAVPAT